MMYNIYSSSESIMLTKTSERLRFILRNNLTGLFLRYSNNITHTGNHIKEEWVENPFDATKLFSLLELDYFTRKEVRGEQFDMIEVRETVTTKIWLNV